MVMCRSYMFEFSVSKDIQSMLHKMGGGNMEDNNTFMPSTNCQGNEN
jgi:hypothetical protein